jgi:zinc protease
MPRSFVFRLAAVLLAFLAATAGAATVDRTLPNGLKVIVKEDPRAPVVASQVWYKAGSIDEFNGTTGVAHVLEHMMFKGTRKVGPGEFSKTIAEAGGRENAFTSSDYTTYFEQLEKSKLPLAFRLEADRMQNLSLSAGEFAKEIQVVMEERRWRTEDKPQSQVYEQTVATAYQAHPYRRPVIGWMNDLQHMTVNDARDWYRRWYAPNNAVLVVVGDVKADEVFKLAQRYFGKLKPHALPPRKPQEEPKQDGIKRVEVKAPAKLPYMLMAYHVPALRNVDQDWEPYALEVLAGVLDGNPAARLNRALVREQQVASEVGAGYDAIARGPSLFVVEGTPSEGKTVGALEGAVRAELERIKKDGVSEEELARVRSQVVAAKVFQRDSMFYQGMVIGQMELTGLSYKDIDTRLAKLQQVAAEQVREVARKYLTDDNLTVGTLDPQPLDSKKPALPPKGDRHDL